MDWSPQQDAALKAVQAWLSAKRGPQVFRLFGFAGTGKTTLATEIAGLAGGKVMFGSFTGKAALVLRRKGCSGASTIHSMIYKAVEQADGSVEFVLNPDAEIGSAELVIIDEVSMVGPDLGKDLLSFGKRVLVLGDPAQLPPIESAGYFTEGYEPDVMLTEIHRQARDNPIIQMATTVREGGKLALGDYGVSRVIERARLKPDEALGADQLICGRNTSRRRHNRRYRALKKFEGITPVIGDKLVCLRNNRDLGLLNGGLWTATAVPPKAKKAAGKKPRNPNPRIVSMTVESEDFAGIDLDVLVPKEFFTGDEKDLNPRYRRVFQEFDFGYALTCHKAQGSQWDDLIVFDESDVFREHASRWAYTALTRAAERVTWVVG